MPKVLILLSTYNGAQYLYAQLKSIYDQRNVDITLLVRDDGSRDSTLDLLDSFSKKYGRMIVLKEDNVGAALSFYKLMFYAYFKMEPFDYYAFSDQDDVWLPSKLETAIKKMSIVKDDSILYFSRAYLVDSELNKIGETIISSQFDYKSALYRNPALGCTMVYTRSFLEKAILIKDYIDNKYIQGKKILLHDAFLFCLAHYTKTVVISDQDKSMLYRQHGNNVTLYQKSFFNKYKFAFKRKLNFDGDNLATIINFLPLDLAPEKKSYINMCVHYKQSLYLTLKFFFLSDFRLALFPDNLLWKLLVLFRLF